jgi:hypothetical protein
MNIDYLKYILNGKNVLILVGIIMFEKLGIHPFNKSDS